jgi:hypothetical protein
MKGTQTYQAEEEKEGIPDATISWTFQKLNLIHYLSGSIYHEFDTSTTQLNHYC